MLMVLQLFHIFYECIPSVVKLESHHVCVQLIVVNKVGMVRKTYSSIVIDRVINSKAEGLEIQLISRVITVKFGIESLSPHKVDGAE